MLRFAWPMLWLGLTLAAAPVRGQAVPPRVELRESDPNPVTSTTTIGFVLHAEVCAKGHVPTVSLQIYNVLVQVVAVPVLDVEQGRDRPLIDLKLPCGTYEAVWDGRLQDGRLAQTGVYYSQLIVDGQRYTQKLIVRRSSSGATRRGRRLAGPRSRAWDCRIGARTGHVACPLGLVGSPRLQHLANQRLARGLPERRA